MLNGGCDVLRLTVRTHDDDPIGRASPVSARGAGVRILTRVLHLIVIDTHDGLVLGHPTYSLFPLVLLNYLSSFVDLSLVPLIAFALLALYS
jgi:hypothetical protein